MKKRIRIGLYFLGVIAFQEIALRLLFPIPEIINFDRVHYMVEDAGKEGAAHLRNLELYWESSPDTNAKFVHQLNRYGFRDDDWTVKKPEGKVRVVFFGDSFVEGVMAAQDETLPAYFAQLREDAEVMNAGLLGEGMDTYLQLAADIIPVFKPDLAFLCIYANDLGKEEAVKVPDYFLEPEYFNSWKPRALEIIDQMNSFGPLRMRGTTSERQLLPKVPEEANPWTKNEAELANHVNTDLATQMKAGTFNPFAANRLQKEEYHLKQFPNLGQSLPFFYDYCNKHETTPVVVYIPSRNQVTNHYLPFEKNLCQINCPDSLDLTTFNYQRHARIIGNMCKEIGIMFIDLTTIVRKEEAAGNHLYWNYDEHMRGKGYRRIAEEIDRDLSNRR